MFHLISDRWVGLELDHLQNISIEFLRANSHWVLINVILITAYTVWSFTSSRSNINLSKKPSGQSNMSSSSFNNPDATLLNPPQNKPFSTEELSRFDGSNPDLPIYVAIKGIVFDVTKKRDVYGPGGSYHIFAGKDGSKGLGMSSLKAQDAVSDYSSLSPAEMKVLDDWVTFFKKRYNIVGQLTDVTTDSKEKL